MSFHPSYDLPPQNGPALLPLPEVARIVAEQAHRIVADNPAEQYTLACHAFALLTGSPPYTGPDAGSVALAHQQQPIPSACARVPSRLPPAVDQVLWRAMAKDPRNRFPDSRTFAAALGSVLPQSPGARRGSGWKIAVAAAAVVVVAGGVVGTLFGTGVIGGSGGGGSEQANPEKELLTQAKETLCVPCQWKHETAASTASKSREVSTGKARSALDNVWIKQLSVIEYNHVDQTCEVQKISVSDVKGDSGTVPATLHLSATQEGKATGSRNSSIRVGYQKVDGKWLISELESVDDV